MLHPLLFLNAQNYLEFGDYRMAIIESRTALEVLIDGMLADAFSGLETGQVREILKLPSALSVSDNKEAIASARINDKLKHGLRKATGASPADKPALWKQWRKAKTLREEAVHYG